MSASLEERLASVDGAIADAARDAGRRPAELTRIVVTKFQPASLVRELAALGVSDFGENRHQEAEAKAEEVADLDLTWHFVGQLQSNKARQVRRYARVVHSVDREALVTALASDAGTILDCFVEVDLSGEPGRGGAPPSEVPGLADQIAEAQGLRLAGVMAVAPLGAPPRPGSPLRSTSTKQSSCEPSSEASAVTRPSRSTEWTTRA